jgi:hypothetical protein
MILLFRFFQKYEEITNFFNNKCKPTMEPVKMKITKTATTNL